MIEENDQVERDEEKKEFLNCDSGDRTAIGETNGGICS